MNLMEFIKSRKPCDTYEIYLERKYITPDTTFGELMSDTRIYNDDKAWLADQILPYSHKCVHDYADGFSIQKYGTNIFFKIYYDEPTLTRVLEEVIDNDQKRELDF